MDSGQPQQSSYGYQSQHAAQPYPGHEQQYGYHPPAAYAPAAPQYSQPSGQPSVQSRGFFPPWEPPPKPVPPPEDSEKQKIIDKLVEYVAKNGPQFENLMKDKQKENPSYGFLFGGEGHDYYRFKLWRTLNPHLDPAHPDFGQQPPQRFYENQPPPPYFAQHPPNEQPYGGGGFQQPWGPPGGLPPEVAGELAGMLNELTGTKESIKSAKTWFMSRAQHAPVLCLALRDRVQFLAGDGERQLHVVYLANDILFNNLGQRNMPLESDPIALAFRPVLGNMLCHVFHNPLNQDANRDRLRKILQFWESKQVYDVDTINKLEQEMLIPSSEPPPNLPGMAPPQPGFYPPPPQQGGWNAPPPFPDHSQGAPDRQHMEPPPHNYPPPPLHGPPGPGQYPPHQGQFQPPAQIFPPPGGMPPYGAPGGPPPDFGPPPQAMQQPPQELPPPYPLFPPGLIPDMVRKLQVGSGVPYSPISPLDIPPSIPPSARSESYILDRIQRYFKEIGETDPLAEDFDTLVAEARAREGDGDGDDQERRMGGAAIPPPAALMQVDPETGMMPDGSVESKAGLGGGGRLGLGASADPNEKSEYDDVYTSYRKQRSSNYHVSLATRAAKAGEHR